MQTKIAAAFNTQKNETTKRFCSLFCCLEKLALFANTVVPQTVNEEPLGVREIIPRALRIQYILAEFLTPAANTVFHLLYFVINCKMNKNISALP